MLDKGKVEFTKLGKRKPASYEIVNEMVMDTWKHVATDKRILNGFRQCGYFDFDGSIDQLHSKLRETIKKREVPYILVKKVNAFIDDIKR